MCNQLLSFFKIFFFKNFNLTNPNYTKDKKGNNDVNVLKLFLSLMLGQKKLERFFPSKILQTSA
jgi:hypothetical protein